MLNGDPNKPLTESIGALRRTAYKDETSEKGKVGAIRAIHPSGIFKGLKP